MFAPITPKRVRCPPARISNKFQRMWRRFQYSDLLAGKFGGVALSFAGGIVTCFSFSLRWEHSSCAGKPPFSDLDSARRRGLPQTAHPMK
jgi:hypothetical protein